MISTSLVITCVTVDFSGPEPAVRQRRRGNGVEFTSQISGDALNAGIFEMLQQLIGPVEANRNPASGPARYEFDTMKYMPYFLPFIFKILTKKGMYSEVYCKQ